MCVHLPVCLFLCVCMCASVLYMFAFTAFQWGLSVAPRRPRSLRFVAVVPILAPSLPIPTPHTVAILQGPVEGRMTQDEC
jgi:hypothetical protein